MVSLCLYLSSYRCCFTKQFSTTQKAWNTSVSSVHAHFLHQKNSGLGLCIFSIRNVSEWDTRIMVYTNLSRSKSQTTACFEVWHGYCINCSRLCQVAWLKTNLHKHKGAQRNRNRLKNPSNPVKATRSPDLAPSKAVREGSISLLSWSNTSHNGRGSWITSQTKWGSCLPLFK